MEIKGFRELTMLDWRGTVAAIVFLGGCNFQCAYCHNHELAFTPETLETIPEDEVFARLDPLKNWIDGVIVSGGEPAVHGPELGRLLLRIREEGFRTKLYTNGSLPAALERYLAAGLLDAVSMDIKHAPGRYGEVVCGAEGGVSERVRRSAELLKNAGIELEFRMTVVKGIHAAGDVAAARELAGPFPFILQNVRPDDIPPPNRDRIAPFPAAEFDELCRLYSREAA